METTPNSVTSSILHLLSVIHFKFDMEVLVFKFLLVGGWLVGQLGEPW